MGFAFSPSCCCASPSGCPACFTNKYILATLSGVTSLTGDAYDTSGCANTDPGQFNRVYKFCPTGIPCVWRLRFKTIGPGVSNNPTSTWCCDSLVELTAVYGAAGILTIDLTVIGPGLGVGHDCPDEEGGDITSSVALPLLLSRWQNTDSVSSDPTHAPCDWDGDTEIPYVSGGGCVDITSSSFLVELLDGPCPDGCSSATAIVAGGSDRAIVHATCPGGCGEAFDGTYNSIPMTGAVGEDEDECGGSKDFPLTDVLCGIALTMTRVMAIAITTGSSETTITATLSWSASIAGGGSATGSIVWTSVVPGVLQPSDIADVVLPFSSQTDTTYCDFTGSTCTVSLT